MTNKLEQIEIRLWALKGSLTVLQGATLCNREDMAAALYLLARTAEEADKEMNSLIEKVLKGEKA